MFASSEMRWAASHPTSCRSSGRWSGDQCFNGVTLDAFESCPAAYGPHGSKMVVLATRADNFVLRMSNPTQLLKAGKSSWGVHGHHKIPWTASTDWTTARSPRSSVSCKPVNPAGIPWKPRKVHLAVHLVLVCWAVRQSASPGQLD